MLFNSIEFLFFFPIVVILYFLCPTKWKWLLLLVASYYFYLSWKPEYLILIVVSTGVDYFCGLKMGSLKSKAARRPYLYISLLSNLGLLFLFKYYNFFNEVARDVAELVGTSYVVPVSHLLLPVGISFYTFQTLSYSIDIYNGRVKPEPHFGIFAVFVSFFPQLVAGPIERSSNLIPQFKNFQSFDYDRVVSGLLLISWGMIKKVVIADRLALFVNTVYDSPQSFDSLILWLATFFFAFQIYCDFSGYSDIAIGSARILGIRLTKNFDTPYFSRSISEFWRRWHITLSSWFRDYVYIPLGGDRVIVWRCYYNIALTFFVSGLWHGANWTFICWGGLHGLYLIIGRSSRPWRDQFFGGQRSRWFENLRALGSVAFTFGLVCFAWIFFRANTFQDLVYILTHLVDGQVGQARDLAWIVVSYLSGRIDVLYSLNLDFGRIYFPMSVGDFVLSCLAILILVIVEFFNGRLNMASIIRKQLPVYRYAVYTTVLFVLFFFGVFRENQFIYFQF